MINVTLNKCQFKSCKNTPLFGSFGKNPQFCSDHKQINMINLVLQSKCDILECDNEYDIIIKDQKYCLTHCPDKNIEISLKKKCKYCDIEETSNYVCKECLKVQNKKEWMVVRYIRKNIDTNFEYNSSKMLQGCSKKRPDIFFELFNHCVIVEIDENQHKPYEDVCECSRINEIVNGICGMSVIIIRFNPDKITNNKQEVKISLLDRLEVLIKIIKEELVKEQDAFKVELIQLYYNDNYKKYKPIKRENITKLVCV
jgi:very-short-patch-repair endonuclease